MVELLPETELATFAGGCFWCLEAVFDELDGVQSVESGYAGGGNPNPTYDDVCSGRTGHAESVRGHPATSGRQEQRTE
jgi:peptide-methionine (S)-S-oxide reductase